jgi:hypothetical protein
MVILIKLPIYPTIVQGELFPGNLTISNEVFPRVMIEEQILNNINVYQDPKDMALLDSFRST